MCWLSRGVFTVIAFWFPYLWSREQGNESPIGQYEGWFPHSLVGTSQWVNHCLTKHCPTRSWKSHWRLASLSILEGCVSQFWMGAISAGSEQHLGGHLDGTTPYSIISSAFNCCHDDPLLEDLELAIDPTTREGRRALSDFSIAYRECGGAARVCLKEENLTDEKGQVSISLWPWVVPPRKLLVPNDDKLCAQIVDVFRSWGCCRVSRSGTRLN